jgi:hypothetical protein
VPSYSCCCFADGIAENRSKNLVASTQTELLDDSNQLQQSNTPYIHPDGFKQHTAQSISRHTPSESMNSGESNCMSSSRNSNPTQPQTSKDPNLLPITSSSLNERLLQFMSTASDAEKFAFLENYDRSNAAHNPHPPLSPVSSIAADDYRLLDSVSGESSDVFEEYQHTNTNVKSKAQLLTPEVQNDVDFARFIVENIANYQGSDVEHSRARDANSMPPPPTQPEMSNTSTKGYKIEWTEPVPGGKYHHIWLFLIAQSDTVVYHNVLGALHMWNSSM